MTRSGPAVCILRGSDYFEPPLRREAEALRDAGYRVEVVMLGSDRVSEDEHVDGVAVHRMPLRRKRGAGNLRSIVDYVLFTVVSGAYVTECPGGKLPGSMGCDTTAMPGPPVEAPVMSS